MTKAAVVRSLLILILAVALWPVSGLATGPPAAQEGVTAPAGVIKELQGALAKAVERFEARDVAGVLTRVSDQYRTGPLTKSGLREQLIAIYSIYDVVRARMRIDEVRLVDSHAWVYSTGEVSGQLPLVGTWVVFLSWQHELEVARREPGNGVCSATSSSSPPPIHSSMHPLGNVSLAANGACRESRRS